MSRSLTNVLKQPSIDTCGLCGQKSGACPCLKFDQRSEQKGFKLIDLRRHDPLQIFNPHAQAHKNAEPTNSRPAFNTGQQGQALSANSNDGGGMSSGPS